MFPKQSVSVLRWSGYSSVGRLGRHLPQRQHQKINGQLQAGQAVHLETEVQAKTVGIPVAGHVHATVMPLMPRSGSDATTQSAGIRMIAEEEEEMATLGAGILTHGVTAVVVAAGFLAATGMGTAAVGTAGRSQTIAALMTGAAEQTSEEGSRGANATMTAALMTGAAEQTSEEGSRGAGATMTAAVAVTFHAGLRVTTGTAGKGAGAVMTGEEEEVGGDQTQGAPAGLQATRVPALLRVAARLLAPRPPVAPAPVRHRPPLLLRLQQRRRPLPRTAWRLQSSRRRGSATWGTRRLAAASCAPLRRRRCSSSSTGTRATTRQTRLTRCTRRCVGGGRGGKGAVDHPLREGWNEEAACAPAQGAPLPLPLLHTAPSPPPPSARRRRCSLAAATRRASTCASSARRLASTRCAAARPPSPFPSPCSRWQPACLPAPSLTQEAAEALRSRALEAAGGEGGRGAGAGAGDEEEDEDMGGAAPPRVSAADAAAAAARRVTRESAFDSALEKRSIGVIGAHWTDKALGDMEDRDWRIMREDFDILVKGGRALK